MVVPPRVVTVWCPEWPTVAAGIPADRPAAVFSANRVVACTPAAAKIGVATGMRRRMAQRVCPELLVVDHDPVRDGREFETVVRAVGDIAPRLEVVQPGWLCLAGRGPSRYFGGDESLAERLVQVVHKVTGAQVSVGIADGRSTSAIAARCAARSSQRYLVVAPGHSSEFVAPLSVVALRELGEISPELVDLFVRLGLNTLGSLASLEAGDVLARFGVDGYRAHRLARAVDERPPAAVDPPPEWWVEHVFPDPVEQLETVVFVAKRLADDLTERLADDGRVCIRLMVLVETEHGERNTRAWYRDRGLSSQAMVERVRWQLEGWVARPGGLSGGVALVRLAPDEVDRSDGVQASLWGGRSQADHDAGRAVVRLSGLVGEQGVRVPEWVGGRLPAERYRLVPASSVELDDSACRLDRGDEPWPGSLPAPSPSIVLSEPLPVELLDHEGHPVSVSGRGEVSAAPVVLLMGNERQRVAAWAGPWPIEQRWWVGERARRLARFQLVTDSGVAHLIGIEKQCWSVLATYA